VADAPRGLYAVQSPTVLTARRVAILAAAVSCVAGACSGSGPSASTTTTAGSSGGLTAGAAGLSPASADLGSVVAGITASPPAAEEPLTPVFPAGDDSAPIAGVKKTPPDPSIMFAWEETAPGATNCQAGHFVGTFMCDLTPEGGTAEDSFSITGPVELTLTKSQNGEFLEISDGHINGFALAIFNFDAALEGKLECSTAQLAANAKDGSIGLGDANLLPVFTFAGQLAGTLDASGDTLNGVWSFPVTTPAGPLGTCSGPWTAIRMP
jgi:hypothetical protein